MIIDELGYALSKQVPDMDRGVTLHTNYGDLVLHGREAERVAALVRRLLQAQRRVLCVIRPMSVRDSGACRYVIPVDVGTGFRRMSVHDSGPCRYL